MNRKIFAYVILLTGLLTLTARSAQAQLDPKGPPKFKVGDRVEFDSIESSDPSRAVWVKATVVRIDVLKLGGGTLTQTSYVIHTDSGREVSVTRHHAEEGGGGQSTGFLRPLAGGDAQPPNTDQPTKKNPALNGPPANTTAAGGKFKKGDCVDFDVLQTGDLQLLDHIAQAIAPHTESLENRQS